MGRAADKTVAPVGGRFIWSQGNLAGLGTAPRTLVASPQDQTRKDGLTLSTRAPVVKHWTRVRQGWDAVGPELQVPVLSLDVLGEQFRCSQVR